MCSRWIGGLLLTMCFVSPAASQDSAAVLQRMEARLDSMQRVVQLRDSAYARASTSDTVVGGGLRIATSPGYRALAHAAAEEAWAQLTVRFGRSVLERLEIPVLDFGVAFSSAPADADTSAVARSFEHAVSQAIWRQQDSLSMTWLRGVPPGGEFSASDLRIVALELVQTPARTNRACFQGEPAACASSLGIRLGADTLADWYPPDTWPRLASLVPGYLTEAERLAKQNCERTGDETDCRAILTPSRMTLPVGSAGRRFLAQLALEAGGANSFERLAGDMELPLGDRLSKTAGVPLDTLLTRWSAAVRAAPLRGPGRPAWELLLGLAWSGLLLVAVLGGARWR